MKTKLLRRVRKEYSIVDHTLKEEIHCDYKHLFGKRERIYYSTYDFPKEYILERKISKIEKAKEEILVHLKSRYPKLGAINNRNNKLWYNS
jgi:hypothetical protein